MNIKSIVPPSREQMHIITTGGTIDKTYNEKNGSLTNKKSIVISKIQQCLRLPYTKLVEHNLLTKDSLNITNDERQKIVSLIDKLQKLDNPIIVIHGTDTLCQTASETEKLITKAKVPIIFTGSIRPIDVVDTDAVQNLTEAILAAKIITPGIFISFHNHIFYASNARKNYVRGTFEYSN